MGFNIEVIEIHNKEALKIRKGGLGLREDWHEPDEQGVTALITGNKFDNAGVEGEIKVLILKDGVPAFAINLATLFAFATEYKEGPMKKT